jgi:hypothetical protein
MRKNRSVYYDWGSLPFEVLPRAKWMVGCKFLWPSVLIS